MSQKWMGLHNHDRHFYSPGYGDRCGKCWYCSPETPCYCCLQAEVEALRARNETLIATIQRQDSTFERQMEEHEELEALRAQVQRVRDVTVPVPGDVYDLDSYTRGAADALALTNKALDGGE